MAETPGVLQRLQLALRIFRRGLPWDPWRMSRKASPLAWPAWREGKPDWHLVDLQAYFEEGFSFNSLVYSAVMYKARSMTSSPLRAYTGDPEHPELLPPGAPLAKLLARPTPYQSGLEWCQLLDVYLNLAGEAFVMMDRPRTGALPTAMYVLRPDRVHPVPEDGGLRGFLYVPEGCAVADGIPVLPTDMAHVKLPNPLDPLEGWGRGLSPLSPAANSTDVDNDVTRFLKKFFERGMAGMSYLSFNTELDEATAARVKRRWQEMYGGWEKWSEVGIIDQGGEVKRLSYTFEEMGFSTIDERNEARILGPFGVPGILIGSRLGLMRGTYSNAQQLREMFWQDTFVPELRLFEAELQFFLSQGDVFPAYDLSGVPALQQDLPKLVEAAYKLWAMGVPANQALESVGLPVPEIPGGDISWLPLAVQSRGALGEPAATADLSKMVRFPKARPAPPAVLTEAARVQAWKAADGVAQSWEASFADAAVAAFDQDQRAVLALLGETEKAARRQKASVSWTQTEQDVQSYFGTKADPVWRDQFVPLLEGLVTDQAQQLATTFRLDIDVRNLLAEQWFETYQLEFAQPISQTSSDALSTLLQQAQREGWSVATTQGHMETLFRQWMRGGLSAEDFAWSEERLPPHRTEIIARTESVRASAAGSQAAFAQAGVAENEWLSTKDGRARDTHAAADGQVRPIGEPFDVGGYPMRYPADGSLGAPASEIVSCRCSLLPVVPEAA